MKLHTTDGGMQVRTDWAALLEAPARAPQSGRHTLIALLAVAALAAACAVAIAMGLHVDLIF